MNEQEREPVAQGPGGGASALGAGFREGPDLGQPIGFGVLETQLGGGWGMSPGCELGHLQSPLLFTSWSRDLQDTSPLVHQT